MNHLGGRKRILNMDLERKKAHNLKSKSDHFRDTCVAWLINHSTLDFVSGHDLMVMRLSPELGSTQGMETT